MIKQILDEVVIGGVTVHVSEHEVEIYLELPDGPPQRARITAARGRIRLIDVRPYAVPAVPSGESVTTTAKTKRSTTRRKRSK